MEKNHYSILCQILVDNGIQKDVNKFKKNILIKNNNGSII